MILRQFILDDLSSAAYLVGDASAGIAAVVDPHLDVEQYIEAASFYGVEIAHVLETHSHADRVSGHGLLAERGAVVHVHEAAAVDYPHEPFVDGWELELGDVRIRALHTPGHRPEHTAFVLSDRRRGAAPWAVLTGDSLFVSDTARPDLAVDPDDGARDLFRSLHGGLLALPADTELWPGHLGGSLCGGPGMDMKTSSTIGYEREHNPVLGIRDEGEFVDRVTLDLPPQPANFHRIVDINRGPFVTPDDEPEHIDLDDLDERVSRGALVIDPRDSVDFDAGHIPGALSNPARQGGFANRLAWLADPEAEIVLLADSVAAGQHLALLVASVGIGSRPALAIDATAAWAESGRSLTTIRREPADALAELRSLRPDLAILDVRERSEWEAGRIEDAVHRPYHELGDGIPELDPSRPVAVICASGQRAGVAASVLARAGFTEPIHIVDGGVGQAIAASPDLAGVGDV